MNAVGSTVATVMTRSIQRDRSVDQSHDCTFSVGLEFSHQRTYKRVVSLGPAAVVVDSHFVIREQIGSGRKHDFGVDRVSVRQQLSVGILDIGCEVLIDDRPLPFAREPWLPLVWFLLPRGPLRA